MGKERTDLPLVGSSGEQGHPAFAGRLGPAGRSRLAVLEEPDARVYRALVLAGSRMQFQSGKLRVHPPLFFQESASHCEVRLCFVISVGEFCAKSGTDWFCWG